MALEFTTISSSAELQTLPVGHYVIPSEGRVEPKWLDIRNYVILENVKIHPAAHVLEELPENLFGRGDITIRPDGKVILGGWMLAEG